MKGVKHMKKGKSYRGYQIIWNASSYGWHWMIYNNRYEFLGSADDGELDSRIDEIESEG